MKSNFFEVLRPGINSTFQDLGRENFITLDYRLVEQWIIEIIYYPIL